MQSELPSLPVTDILPELASTLIDHDRVVLQAPTGAGKTTLVPLYLLRSGAVDGRIIMLEPRRLAASAAAARMADLIGEPVGETVGYRMQLESRVSARTRIEVVTEGILTRMLQTDPELSGISMIIFDEFHERSLAADLGLALTLQSQECYREDPLKLLIMSATLQADKLGNALNAPVVVSEGFSYPVTVYYRDKPISDRNFHSVCSEVSRTILTAVTNETGSILAFLPGAGEIRQVEKLLNDRSLPEKVTVLPLFGEMSLQQQRQAIRAPEDGSRKIVLATNIAETSLTIAGISVVVDSGLVRRAVYDPGNGMTRLETRRLTRSNADQRKGRAGRLESGTCYRLWSESEDDRLERKETAEIEEADLAPLALELCNWGAASPDELFWLTPPAQSRYNEAMELLQQLQAVEQLSSGSIRITGHGTKMAQLGTHPRIAHMLLTAAAHNSLETGCRLAAILTERDLLRGGQNQSADISLRMALFENSAGADQGNLHRARQLAKQWQRRLGKSASKAIDQHSDLSHLLLAAYPDRVAQRRGLSNHYLLNSGQGIELQPDDPLVTSEYLVTPGLGGHSSRTNARVFLAFAIDKTAIYDQLTEQIREVEHINWDESLGRVSAVRQDRLGALVLEQQNIASPAPEKLCKALLSGVCQSGLNSLHWDKESRQLRERMQFLHRFNEAMETPLPDVSENALLETLEDWLGPFIEGMTRLEQLKKLSLKGVLLAMLDWPSQQLLEQEAPAHWQAPSGSSIRIDYSKPEEPKVSVRLQEIFGLTDTPVIGFGRQPMTIELLSPAHRPVQITRDLNSFWKNTYQEVKKDLKGRYPKHYWPDDPMTAEATRFTRPRR
ncbi:MAG: ATP-dependent helicase HrpB [Endozoicomonas sp.]